MLEKTQFQHPLPSEAVTIFLHIILLCFWAIFPVPQLSGSTDLLEAKEEEENWGHNLCHHRIHCRRPALQLQEDAQSYYTHLPVMMPASDGKRNGHVGSEDQVWRNKQGLSKGDPMVPSLELHRHRPHFVLYEILRKWSFLNQLSSSKTYGSLQLG